MAFVRWQARKKFKSRPDVKISRTTIQLSPEAVQRFQIGSNERVSLYWDQQRHMIGFAPSQPDDSDGVTLKHNARTGFASIAAKLFFSSLGLEGTKVTNGNLRIVEGVMALDVDVPANFESSAVGQRIRLGRRPKAGSS